MDKIINIKCGICGSQNIEIHKHDRIGICKSCNSKMILPDFEDHECAALLDDAKINRQEYKFDEAISKYDFILQHKNNHELAAFEGKLLAKYGIVFVFDKKSKINVPTCNRYNPISVFEDEDYLSYIENCETEKESNYFKELALKIDNLQKGITKQLKKEIDYDIFISYKAKNDDNKTTEDAYIAREIYEHLINCGYKVFFSEITLKERISEEFEPIIYRALHSAKFMILVGTSKENISSPWVKNEWSRYIDRINDVNDSVDKSSLICVYKGLNPSYMPRVKGHILQCVDASDLGHKRNISDYIKKSLNPTKEDDEEEILIKAAKINRRIEKEQQKAILAEKKAENAIKKQKEFERLANSRRERDLAFDEETQRKMIERKKRINLFIKTSGSWLSIFVSILCLFTSLSFAFASKQTTFILSIIFCLISFVVSFCYVGKVHDIKISRFLLYVLPLWSYTNLMLCIFLIYVKEGYFWAIYAVGAFFIFLIPIFGDAISEIDKKISTWSSKKHKSNPKVDEIINKYVEKDENNFSKTQENINNNDINKNIDAYVSKKVNEQRKESNNKKGDFSSKDGDIDLDKIFSSFFKKDKGKDK